MDTNLVNELNVMTTVFPLVASGIVLIAALILAAAVKFSPLDGGAKLCCWVGIFFIAVLAMAFTSAADPTVVLAAMEATTTP